MTITLDDVLNLLHMPIVGQFYTHQTLDANAANDLFIKSLHVDRGVAYEETRYFWGTHVCLSWLRDVYEDARSRRQWIVAARAYLLHLVGYTVFTDKSATSKSAIYLEFFFDIRLTGWYAWVADALTHKYEQLGDCSYAKTRQLVGYATLLQGWIYEHFPSIGMRHVQSQYSEEEPRCRIYELGKVNSILVVWLQLDTLTPTCIRFSPYNKHREEHPFEWISSFSGYLRFWNWRQLHLPERAIRQYEYVQIIPRHPSVVKDGDLNTNEVDRRWLHFNDYVIQDMDVTPYSGACV